MRTATFNYIKAILADYYKTDEYIKQREEELRYPHHELDLNEAIKGTKTVDDRQVNLMMTIEQDKRLTTLERNKRIVSSVLQAADNDTKIIIEELYMKRWGKYTMQGLVTNKLIHVGRTKAFELRDKFFREIANGLNLTL